MGIKQKGLKPDEAAAATMMDVRIIWYYADLGLITPSADGYTEDDLAELRRVRRLREDLGLDDPEIEIILRMRRHIQRLQAEIRSLKLALRATRRPLVIKEWVDADWEELI